VDRTKYYKDHNESEALSLDLRPAGYGEAFITVVKAQYFMFMVPCIADLL